MRLEITVNGRIWHRGPELDDGTGETMQERTENREKLVQGYLSTIAAQCEFLKEKKTVGAVQVWVVFGSRLNS